MLWCILFWGSTRSSIHCWSVERPTSTWTIISRVLMSLGLSTPLSWMSSALSRGISCKFLAFGSIIRKLLRSLINRFCSSLSKSPNSLPASTRINGFLSPIIISRSMAEEAPKRKSPLLLKIKKLILEAPFDLWFLSKARESLL